MRFWHNVKELMLSPTETFNRMKDEAWGSSMEHYLKSLVIFASLQAVILIGVFAAVVSFIAAFVPFLTPFITVFAGLSAILGFIFIILGGLIGILYGSLWMHIWVYAFGSRKGVEQTIKSLAYGSTPSLMFGWIPLGGIIFSIWSLVVSIIGIRQLHEISTGRAVAAFILGAIVIPGIVTLIAAFVGLLVLV